MPNIFGLDWIGLDWIGLDWLNRAGSLYGRRDISSIHVLPSFFALAYKGYYSVDLKDGFGPILIL